MIRKSYKYQVYMIHLKKDVLKEKKFLQKNPHYDIDSGKPCVYIGYSSLTPEERFEQHKNRVHKKKRGKNGQKVPNWNKYAARYHDRLEKKKNLLKRVYYKKSVAMKAEQGIAEHYRKKGYAVWGGQKEE